MINFLRKLSQEQVRLQNQVKPTEEVPVETPAHKTPTLDVERDPQDG